MRPLRLEFQAFGAYPGREVVDFNALSRRGLFVVAGPTGSGKTTVFDAMVYALYGVLPGQRVSAGEPRSHHAAADVETVVTLDFEVEGIAYRVRRQPEWERPKKRGGGTTKQASTATLERVVGGVPESLATQFNACSKQCASLVGLDPVQFQRVVLLPQGKFTEFLISTDDDREKLLRQLFSGEVYEHVVLWLRDEVRRLDGEVGEVDTQVQHHRHNAVASLTTVEAEWRDEQRDTPLETLGDTELSAAVDALQPVQSARQDALALIQAQATAATEKKTEATAAAARFDAAERARQSLAALQAEREAVASGKRAAELSCLARPVVKAADEAEAARRQADTAAASLEEERAAIAAGFSALGRVMPAFDAASVATAVEQCAAQLEADEQLLAAADAAVARADATGREVEATRAVRDGLAAAVADIRTALDALKTKAASLEPLANAVVERRTTRDASTDRLATHASLRTELQALDTAEQGEEAAKASYETLMARFVATQAPRLAERLEDGKPCPVCGATAHPAPARLGAGDAIDHHAVDAARGSWSNATARVASHRSALDSLRARLGNDVAQPAEFFVAALAAAETALCEAQDAARELAAARTGVLQREEELGRALDLEQQKALALAGLEERAWNERRDADQRASAAARIDAVALRASLAALGSLKAAAADLARRFDGVTATRTRLDAATDVLAEQLTGSGYQTPEAARDVLLDAAQEAGLLQRAAAWDASVRDETTRLTQLVAQGLPDVRPDVEALTAAASAVNAEAADALRRFTTASNALQAALAALQQVSEIAAGSADLRRRRDTARIVFRTCNGEAGSRRMKLERWVLGGELDRVTRAANAHLATMTAGRYRLERVADSRGGLTLAVFDSHTGRSRATASLSGGEQFQASLALALGLADVVSHGGVASGRQFEALFVDEGFGSLDPDALDEAMSALSTLQAGGRVVGAITHVEAMKERLHVGIEVRRRPDGKGSTLLVHP